MLVLKSVYMHEYHTLEWYLITMVIQRMNHNFIITLASLSVSICIYWKAGIQRYVVAQVRFILLNVIQLKEEAMMSSVRAQSQLCEEYP